MDKKKKLTLQLLLGAFLVLVGVVLLFLGFYAPAVGEIANSVLVAYGEVSTFAGALIGVDYKYKYQVYKLDEEERIRHKDNSESD
jgi:hypothetical protein